jgi:hypothetical protein
MDVRVRVDVPDGSKVMSEDHQTELRAVGALYSE